MSTKTKKDKKSVEVVVFEDPLKKRKRKYDRTNADFQAKAASRKDSIPEFNQKRAKYDIRKLAMNGMDKTEKELAMADFLVELGAKKPKEKHMSIKEYMQDPDRAKAVKKDNKNELLDDDEKKKSKSKKNRDKDDIFDFMDGQVGTYRKGVQFLKHGKKGKK